MDGNSSMYDFVIDGEQAMEWINAMQLGVRTLDDNVASIYEEIELMNEGWKGSAYESFKQNAISVRKHFDSVKDLISVYDRAVSSTMLRKFSPVMRDINTALKALEEAGAE